MLPAEAWRKRRLEQELARVFYQWGYQEVVTPTFEYYQALAAGDNGNQEESLFKFLDRQGQILALRSELTTPIARLAATRLKDARLPLRLFYLANVFNYAEPQVGRQREFFQAGVEFVGPSNGEADGEVVALAVEVLKTAGLRNFQIHLGQMAVFNGVMAEIGLDEEGQTRFKNTLGNKDFVGVEEVLAAAGAAPGKRARIMELLSLRGGVEVLERAAVLLAGSPALAGLDNLREVFTVLEHYGVADYVVVDFSILRGFDYYTGVIFEGYAQHLGFPICGGGRYDKLLGRFGHPCPATGFAVGLERMLLALERQGDPLTEPPAPDVLIIYRKAQRSEAIKQALELRSQGLAVETAPLESAASADLESAGLEKSLEALREYARNTGIGRVIEL